MENGSFLNQDYFEHLLAEIREIRLSERRFYQKITDIYACSVDFNPNSQISRDFFAKVQNKLHFAIHRYTAAELIVERADSEKTNMGLTSWKKHLTAKLLRQMLVLPKTICVRKRFDCKCLSGLSRITG